MFVRSFVSHLALAVPRSRRVRLPLSSVRVRRWFCLSRVAAVSIVLNVGSRLALVSVLRVWCWFAFGVGRSACVAVSFVHVVGSGLLVVALRVSRWFWSFCVCGGFVSFVPWFGASC